MLEPCKHRRIVAAGMNCDEIAALLPFARALGSSPEDQILVLGLVVVPEETSLSTGALPARRLREELKQLAEGPRERTSVRVAHDPWKEACAVLEKEECDLFLVSGGSPLPAEALQAMPCDVLILHGAVSSEIRRILLPVRGGLNAALMLEATLAIAQANNAEITVLHTVNAAQVSEEMYQEFLSHLRSLPRVTRWIKMRGDPVKTIVNNAREADHQLLVMGAIARPRPGDPPIGPTAMRVAQEAGIPVLIVKIRKSLAADTAPAELPPVDYTISVVVDKWFAENSFHAHEFAEVKRLVALKERQGVKISLGLPALNEEATIGPIIKKVRSALMERIPLLDEIVVIDSNSTDRTVEIATDLGVPVYRHSEILPEEGSYAGKGEALWKSLYVLRGDIIAWIDTDIVNIHPRFVYGVLGPLLQEPRLKYVKGFYQRPLRLGGRKDARGGGRVTELTARPLFNLFYPELSGLAQPLAGEYAGRRDALDKLPFFTGYGVETGLLIDLLECFGLQSIGQVDLEERVHRNQTLPALSKMAFAITQVVLQRVETRRQIRLLDALNASMKLVRYGPDHFWLEILEIRDHERPPMYSLPAYRQAFGISA